MRDVLNTDVINELTGHLDRLRSDFVDAVSAWAIWEGLNGFPDGENRHTTHMLLNSTTELFSVKSLQTHLANATVLSLLRMMDSVDNRNRNRQSLPRVALLLKNQRIFEVLLSSASQSSVISQTNVSLKVTSLCQQRFFRWVDGIDENERNISTLKPKLKKLRDNWLAHSLEDPAASEVNAFLVRDALILCGAAIEAACLSVLGLHWSPKYYWRLNLKQANHFWDTYTLGLSAAANSKILQN